MAVQLHPRRHLGGSLVGCCYLKVGLHFVVSKKETVDGGREFIKKVRIGTKGLEEGWQ